jgi:hypothetical protein
LARMIGLWPSMPKSVRDAILAIAENWRQDLGGRSS